MVAANPVKHAKGVKLVLKVSSAESPDRFHAICSINAARGITFTSALDEFEEVDCTDPERIAWIIREKRSLSCKFQGAGLLNTPDARGIFEDMLVTDDSLNCQVVIDVLASLGGIIWEGYFHTEEFAITGERGGKLQFSISMASDGAITVDTNT